MIHTVSTSVELEAVFRTASSGDRIELLGGNYQAVRLKNRDFEDALTITSADPDDPAVFRDALMITGTSGVDVTNINFAPQSAALDILDLVLVSGSSNISLKGNKFTGHLPEPGEGLAPGQDIDSSAKAKGLIEGVAFARGIRITDSNSVLVEDSSFTQLRKGIILDTVSDVSISGNHLHDLRSDGINLVDAVSVSIAGNLMENFHPLHNYDNIAFADHGDFIQWWAGDGGLGIQDLTIRDNALLQGSGSWVQGIFGRSGGANPDGSPSEFSDIRIENNLINASHTNGIFVGDAKNVDIVGNTLLPAPQDLTQPVITSGIPAIHVRTSGTLLPDGSYDFSDEGALPQDVSIRENVIVGETAFQSYRIDAALHAPQRIVETDNQIYSHDSNAETWFGFSYPEMVDAQITTINDLTNQNSSVVGFDYTTLPQHIQGLLADPARNIAPIQSGTSANDVLQTDGTGRIVYGGGGADVITGTDASDRLRGGTGSDQYATGLGADLVAFHESDLAPGDLDTITDLDFDAGDWISFSGGFGAGFFNDTTDADNALTTFGSGDSAIVHDLADLAEIVAMDSVSAVSTLPEAIDVQFDLDGDGSKDWTLRLFGISGIGETPAAAAVGSPTIEGTPVSEVLRGEANSADRIFGGDGDDMLDGRSGGDEMFGGDGDDRFYVDDASDQVIEYAGQGYDRVYASVDYTLPTAVEAIAARSTANLRLTGNGGDNWITGNTGNDALRGGAGRDRLISRDGNDWLDGGSGDDILQGGGGDDRYVVDSSADRVLEEAAQGYDRVYTTVDFSLSASVEALSARGNGDVSLTGNAEANWITGNLANNRLSGAEGNDRLIGRDGNDTLTGGRGNDVLQGGNGIDVFTFEEGDGQDLITDFEAGTDLLLIEVLEASNTLNAIETTSGVTLIFGNSGDRVVLQNMTEAQLAEQPIFATGHDWTVEF